MKNLSPYFVLCSFLLFSLPMLSQSPFFKPVSSLELTKKKVTIRDMSQDPQGHIWLATDKGLYRYNGFETKLYLIEGIKETTANNIQTVYADDKGLIWCSAIFLGLHCLNPKTGTFKHFTPNTDDPNSLSSKMITDILKDKKGFLWVATSNGLNRLDINSGKFTRFQHDTKMPNSLSNNDVNVLYEDKKGILWVGTASGLNRFNPQNGQFIKYLNQTANPKSLINNNIKAIFEDSRGVFWVGTEGTGVHIMNRETGAFQRHIYIGNKPVQLNDLRRNASKVKSEDIKFIMEDAAKNIWIGTNLGVYVYNYKTNGIRTFFLGDKNAFDTVDNDLSTGFISKDSIVWITLYNGNVYQYDPYFKITNYQHTGFEINGMHRDASGSLWFLSNKNNELIRQDPITANITRYTHNPNNPQSLSLFSKEGLLNKRFAVGQNNKLWIATNVYGLDCFDKHTQSVTHFRHSANNPNTIMTDTVDYVYEEGNNLWIGSNLGLDLMSLKTGKFVHFVANADTTGLMNANVLCVLSEKDKVWIGGIAGLNQLNPATGKFKYYLRGMSINYIFKDSYEALWLGTDYGIYKYNPQSDKFTLFKVSYGLSVTERIGDIQEDGRKNLWIATDDKFFKINATRDFIKIIDTEKGSSLDTLIEHGYGAKGEMLFFKGMGYYSITEGDVRYNPFPPKIYMHDFKIVGKNTDVDILQSEAFLKDRNIVLTHNQNIFSFNITPIHYSKPNENQVLYKLDNYDEEWRSTNADKRANFTNVPPGKYLLRVKAFNNAGVWSESTYLITIMPPWWKTIWAYLLYILLFIIFVRIYTHYRSRILKHENALLESKVKERTNELALKSTELEKSLQNLKDTQTQLIQSEKLASLGELTAGIAHEIQNPLNFVNNFSELSIELIDELNSPLTPKGGTLEAELLSDISQNLDKINHHGKRASNIVKGMLEHSRASTGVIEPTDINKLADEYLRLAYHGLRAKDKSFNADFRMAFDKNLPKIDIIPQDMGRVLLNLFNNAFYAVSLPSPPKPPEGELPATTSKVEPYFPTVIVSTHYQSPPSGAGVANTEGGGSIIIKVQDNGIGMPEATQEKIFQPFFTTKPTGQGTGLGLSLAYDIVKAHGGEIKVDSKENEGTIFSIVLPIQ